MKRFHHNYLMRKMTRINTGLFYNFSEDFMKTPVSIIQVRDSDRYGNLYFEMPRPYRDMGGVEKTFFSKIQFFNRLCHDHVMAEGYATICDDQNNWYDHSKSEKISIQFHITDAYCIRHRKKKVRGILILIQEISLRLLKDYHREQEWVPIPA